MIGQNEERWREVCEQGAVEPKPLEVTTDRIDFGTKRARLGDKNVKRT